MKEPLVIIAGPTAVGKTSLSVKLAQALCGEIISADSMQVYRGMDIGTAKIREEEKQGIPHFLIDECSPAEEFHVARFKDRAEECIRGIRSRGHLPILVGGTGFYIQAVLYDISFEENGPDEELRSRLWHLAEEKGALWLHERLAEVDPESAGQIHANNVKRVIRALEYYHQSGEPISRHNAREQQKESPYSFCYFVLDMDRQALYSRIGERIDEMLGSGLVEEVERLRKQGCTREMVSMQALGYKEILAYLDGEMGLVQATELLKRDTRHFAKRQLTWFHRERGVTWIRKEDFEGEAEILDFLAREVQNKTGWNVKNEK